MTSPLFTRQSMPAHAPSSLVFSGDTLVDWASGGTTWRLDDGSMCRGSFGFGYRFDAACISADGRTVAVYERLGTKAVLLRDGRVLRELNRSYYHADAYEYPIALFDGPDGRLLLAHCPDGYNRLDIDDATTGERLTAHPQRKPQDFFHSRLTLNPARTRLMSAGWVWHPADSVEIFDVAAALADPRLLDGPSRHLSFLDARVVGSFVEQSSAAWQTDDRIILGGGEEDSSPADIAAADARGPRRKTNGVAVYDLRTQRCLAAASLGQPAGTLMAVGAEHAVAFFEHPKLFELATGRIVHAWPDLATGAQKSSIVRGTAPLPPLALDAAHARFAVADDEQITVVSLNRAAL